ncbi:MAG: hypothetical protein PUC13_02110 [Lachnospiraceae bacterium]|nr:hypothetical protein [Lachnospiraceae bacterium]
MAKHKKSIKNLIGILALVTSIALIVLYAYEGREGDVWYDEVFSLVFSSGSISDAIRLTGMDVHPPLYYIYLILINKLAAIFGSVSVIPLCKLASIVPWVFILTAGYPVIKKRYGWFTYGLFMLMITGMPQIGNYYIEIRMYSLALAIITLAGFAALSILEREETYKWLMLGALVIMAAYTQYYALIAAVGVCIALFILILISGKKRGKLLKHFVFMTLACVFMFLPWIPTLLSQITRVSSNYWIQPLSLRSIGGCIKYIVLPICGDGIIVSISAILLVLSLLAGAVLIIYKRNYKSVYRELIVGIVPIATVIISGFVLSAIGRPIFVYRYMIPVLGLLFFAIAVCLNLATERGWAGFVLIPAFLLCIYFQTKGMYYEEIKKVEHMPEVSEAFEGMNGSAIITNFDHMTMLSAYYMKDSDIYLFESTMDELVPKLLTNISGIIELDEMEELVNSEGEVYFLGSFNQREEIVDKWSKLNINIEEVKDCLVERYWFRIYRLTPR